MGLGGKGGDKEKKKENQNLFKAVYSKTFQYKKFLFHFCNPFIM